MQAEKAIIKAMMQFSQYILVVVTLWGGFVMRTSASDVTLNLYKNKDVLATRTIPDITALKLAHGDHKNNYFTKLLAAWDNLNFDRTFISRGKLNDIEMKKSTLAISTWCNVSFFRSRSRKISSKRCKRFRSEDHTEDNT